MHATRLCEKCQQRNPRPGGYICDECLAPLRASGTVLCQQCRRVEFIPRDDYICPTCRAELEASAG